MVWQSGVSPSAADTVGKGVSDVVVDVVETGVGDEVKDVTLGESAEVVMAEDEFGRTSEEELVSTTIKELVAKLDEDDMIGDGREELVPGAESVIEEVGETAMLVDVDDDKDPSTLVDTGPLTEVADDVADMLLSEGMFDDIRVLLDNPRELI